MSVRDRIPRPPFFFFTCSGYIAGQVAVTMAMGERIVNVPNFTFWPCDVNVG